MKNEEIFVVGGARTPMTEYMGALKDLTAVELAAVASKEALTRTGVEPSEIGHVKLRYGLATACIGGGQGIAILLEAA